MVNCNPETVSTDYDTSDRLYFEPLTAEDVANVLEAEQARPAGRLVGVIVSPRAARPRSSWPPRSTRGAGARHVARPPSTWPRTASGGTPCAHELGDPPAARRHGHHPGRGAGRRRPVGYPVLVRPSYVLGGRAMEIVYDDERRAAGRCRP